MVNIIDVHSPVRRADTVVASQAFIQQGLPMASVRQFEYFLAVADCGSLRQAAVKLDVSQPTLTVQLRSLEESLGVTLLERSRNATLLSPAGRSLLPEVRQLLSQWRGLVETANLLGEHSHSTYRLGVPPTLGPYLLPTLLPFIHKEFSQLRLHVKEAVPDQLANGLEQGEFDLIIGPVPDRYESLIREPLFREPLLLAVPSDADVQISTEFAKVDLKGMEVLAMDERHSLRREVERICEQMGTRLNRDFEGTSLDTLRQMVVMGMGIAFLPALYVRSEIHRPEELTIQAVQGRPLFREHALLFRSNAPSRTFYRELTALIKVIIVDQLSDTVTPL